MNWIKIFSRYGFKGLLKDWYYSLFGEMSVYSVKEYLERNVGLIIDNYKKYNLPIYRGTYDDKMLSILRYVRNNFKYVSDQKKFNQPEMWEDAIITEGEFKGKGFLETMTGDCIAEYEEIWTADGPKKAKDIKLGDEVLSYDFDKKAYINKKIINLWDKGIQSIKRVHFRNGQHIDVTNEHHMLMRFHRDIGNGYEKKDLKDVDLTKWEKRKVPTIKQLPYTIKDISWLDIDLCFVVGHFLAEGWCEKYKVQSSGYELNDYIIPILEEYGIPFTEYKNNSGVPCINFLKSDFKEFIKMLKNNSFDIDISNLLSLPKEKLKSIRDGFFLGDGNDINYIDKRGYANNVSKQYSTSCEQFARQLCEIGLKLGKPLYFWKQENHQGVGDKPIYRLHYNKESYFNKDYGFDYLSETSISYIEDIGEHQTYDWEVEDTHNFFFRNGICTSQCETGATLILGMAIRNGISKEQLRFWAGMMDINSGHATLVYRADWDMDTYALDWCYLPDLTKFPYRRKFKNLTRYKKKWFEVTLLR